MEESLKQEGIENSGMLTLTEKGLYELRYNDLIAPTIKVIQEMKKENEKLHVRIEKLEGKTGKNNPGSKDLV